MGLGYSKGDLSKGKAIRKVDGTRSTLFYGSLSKSLSIGWNFVFRIFCKTPDHSSIKSRVVLTILLVEPISIRVRTQVKKINNNIRQV